MENKVYDILVNFNDTDSITSSMITIVKGDYNSVELNFQINKNSLLQMFYLIRPDGTSYVSALKNNKILIDSKDIFNITGRYYYGISLYDENSKLTNLGKGIIDVTDGFDLDEEEIRNDSNYKILDDLINEVNSLIPTYNNNAEQKLKQYNDNSEEKLNLFNSNYSKKLDSFNSNYNLKLDSFNANALKIEEDAEKTTGITFSKWANSKRIEENIKNFFAMTPDDKVYTVRFPMWDKSQTCNGEKLDDNVDKYVNLATDKIREESNYGIAWNSYDCNAVVDDDGIRHIVALKGMPNYKDVGEVDVFCLFRTYYQKIWEEDGYLYISRTFLPKDGYTVVPQAINKDGTINPWFVIGKYAVGTVNGVLYSSKGLIPAHYVANSSYSNNISYNDCVTKMHKKGTYYSAGLMSDYMHILTTFYLKFATKNTQSIMAGNTSNSFQYQVSQAENNVKRVILTTSQANNFDIGTYVSVGDPTTNTNRDRYNGYMHNIAYNVRILSKETFDSTHTALVLDCDDISTTETTWVSTMHEISGYSDDILGRNGSLTSNTNGKHGFVLDGIELSVGGYEVGGNAFMDIVDTTGKREIYITNDASKLTTNITTAKSTYKKCKYNPYTTIIDGWKYITEMKFDTENGIVIPTKCAESGSGSNTGYADAYVAGPFTSGQREFLLLGALYIGTSAGLACLNGNNAVSSGNWYFLARLSINGVGGELAE